MDDEISAQLLLLPKLGRSMANAGKWCELLNKRGYLNCSVKDAALSFGVDTHSFLKNLRMVQDWIEPAGFFALDLSDCLMIQLRRKNIDASDAVFILKEGRKEIENGELETFMKRHAWDMKRVESALAILRKLDPNPGYAFSKVENIIPEIEFTVDGEIIMSRVMSENLPRLSLIAGANVGWDSEIIGTATSIMRRLEERERTLGKVASFLASVQNDYLYGKTDSKRPLRLKDISVATGLHTSTISRVLNVHWAISDIRGIFKLSSLLLRKVICKDTKISRLDYAYLERVIKSAAHEGLSDADLSKFLGIPRRTVTYHRLRLGLSPAKREK
jgi:RNA polymerase sigma-54 factor